MLHSYGPVLLWTSRGAVNFLRDYCISIGYFYKKRTVIGVTEKLARGALDELNFDFASQVVLFTALKLDIFSVIDKEAKGVDEIASAVKCSARGMRMLLNCLAAMELLEKENETYALNRLSRKTLLPSSKDYIGSLFMHWEKLVKLWLTLPEAVKTGKPTLGLFTDEEKERLNIDIADALFQVHKGYAWGLAEALEISAGFLPEHGRAMKILDVAAGSAVWSLPLALKYERAEVTAIDFASVLEVAKRYARRFGVESQYKFIGADIRQIDFGNDEYDLALLGHICHSEGAEWSRRLIGKCFRALKENGKLFIMDYVPDEERESDVMPLLLAINALLGTEEGDTFTFSQYKNWLLNAGFREARTIRVNDHSPVIVGLKD